MVGIYVAYSAGRRLSGALGWAFATPAADRRRARGVDRVVLLRCIYKAPELFQLLGHVCPGAGHQGRGAVAGAPTNCWALRRAGPLPGSVSLLGQQFPSYDLFLIVVGPLVLGAVWLLLTRTRFRTGGAPHKTADGERSGRQPGLVVHGRVCAGRDVGRAGGALQLPREPATLRWICTPSVPPSWWWWWAAWARYPGAYRRR